MRLRPKKATRDNAARLLPRLARRFFDDLDRALSRDLSPKKAHDLRILTKRLRYSLEYFRPCYGDTVDGYVKKIRELQQVLGVLNDCRSSRKIFSALLSNDGRPSGAKKLFQALEQRESEFLVEFRKAWQDGFRSAKQRNKLLRYLSHPMQPRAARKARKPLQPVEISEPEAVA